MPARFYVIYYGWLTGADGQPTPDAHRIAAAKPAALIAPLLTSGGGENLGPAALGLLGGAGTRLLAYVAAGYGRRGGAAIGDEVDRALAAGLDGVFMDEAPNFLDEGLARGVREQAGRVLGQGGTVVLNPGVGVLGEAIMDAADIVMVEHRWRELRAGSPWVRRYPAERFMGVSSNEPDALPYRVGPWRAARDARAAGRAHIGWHYATDRFTALPTWFERHARSRPR